MAGFSRRGVHRQPGPAPPNQQPDPASGAQTQASQQHRAANSPHHWHCGMRQACSSYTCGGRWRSDRHCRRRRRGGASTCRRRLVARSRLPICCCCRSCRRGGSRFNRALQLPDFSSHVSYCALHGRNIAGAAVASAWCGRAESAPRMERPAIGQTTPTCCRPSIEASVLRSRSTPVPHLHIGCHRGKAVVRHIPVAPHSPHLLLQATGFSAALHEGFE